MIDFAPIYPETTLDNALVRRLGLHCRFSTEHRSHRILDRDGFGCVYCGTDLLANLDSLIMTSVDHVIPKSAGGGKRWAQRVPPPRASAATKATQGNRRSRIETFAPCLARTGTRAAVGLYQRGK